MTTSVGFIMFGKLSYNYDSGHVNTCTQHVHTLLKACAKHVKSYIGSYLTMHIMWKCFSYLLWFSWITMVMAKNS